MDVQSQWTKSTVDYRGGPNVTRTFRGWTFRQGTLYLYRFSRDVYYVYVIYECLSLDGDQQQDLGKPS
jgi:hypothetical protein